MRTHIHKRQEYFELTQWAEATHFLKPVEHLNTHITKEDQ